MIESGNKGLYGNLGIDVRFTIPGNPESKSIEAFWDYCISEFEKSFVSWIGNDIESRPEIFKNMDNKVLARKYGNKFPTWDEFCEKLNKFIQYYNNKVRESLVNIDGDKFSPIEAYNQVEHLIPSRLELEHKMVDPYFEMRVVQKSMIEKNGILYWHPIFASLVGTKIGIYYDEKNLREITICNDRGQKHMEKAIAIDPGLQSGDDFKALIENNRRVKLGKLCYLALCDVSGAQKIEKMLKILSDELLPLSNSQQLEYEEVKYLSFDDALNAVAGEDEGRPPVESEKCEVESDSSDEDKDMIASLKEDIAGMFGG
jgi:hypothetical protein